MNESNFSTDLCTHTLIFVFNLVLITMEKKNTLPKALNYPETYLSTQAL